MHSDNQISGRRFRYTLVSRMGVVGGTASRKGSGKAVEGSGWQ